MLRLKLFNELIYACAKVQQLQATRFVWPQLNKAQSAYLICMPMRSAPTPPFFNGKTWMTRSITSIANLCSSSKEAIRKHSTYLDCFMTQNGEELRKKYTIELLPIATKPNEPKNPKQTTDKQSIEKPTNNKTINPNVPDKRRSVTIILDEKFKLHCLDCGPKTKVKLSKDKAKKYYRQMKTIRCIENAAEALYRERIIRGYCHLYTGQEACAVGMRAAMRENDKIITANRCHGWAYLMGLSPVQILSELSGKEAVPQSYKPRSLHMYAKHFYTGKNILHSNMPGSAAVSFSSKFRNKGTCLAVYGDGVANQGEIFEAYNMAYLWKLPCVFVCENNTYGVGSRVHQKINQGQYYARGECVPGIWVDAMNVLAVKNATRFALKYARRNGPIILEMNTHRSKGHGRDLGSETKYRVRDSITEAHDSRDPLLHFYNLCKQYGLLCDEEAKEINSRVHKDVRLAVENAKTDREVEMKELIADVYAKCIQPENRDKNFYYYSRDFAAGKNINRSFNG